MQSPNPQSAIPNTPLPPSTEFDTILQNPTKSNGNSCVRAHAREAPPPVIPTPSHVIPATTHVIPATTHVIPAKAGIPSLGADRIRHIAWSPRLINPMPTTHQTEPI